jgi:SNF2 family DNA or RNA helicase
MQTFSWWNPAAESQATDRAHRIGQENKVIVAKMITAGTVEEKILEMQQNKKEMAEAVVRSDKSIIRALTPDMLMGLFDN